MSWWNRLRTRIHRSLYLPARAERDMDDEIRFHLTEEARLQSDRGLSPAEAEIADRKSVV